MKINICDKVQHLERHVHKIFALHTICYVFHTIHVYTRRTRKAKISKRKRKKRKRKQRDAFSFQRILFAIKKKRKKKKGKKKKKRKRKGKVVLSTGTRGMQLHESLSRNEATLSSV